MTEAFHARHADAYGFANEREPVQFVNLRLTAHRPGRPADGAPPRAGAATASRARSKLRARSISAKAGGMVDERHLRARSAARRRPLLGTGDRRADGLHDGYSARRDRHRRRVRQPGRDRSLRKTRHTADAAHSKRDAADISRWRSGTRQQHKGGQRRRALGDGSR